MQRPGEDDLGRVALRSLTRFLIGFVVPFLLAAGGVALAAWAMDTEQEVLGIAGLCIAGFGFLWLFLLNAMFSGWGAGGEEVSLGVYIFVGLIALGGGAAVMAGIGLLMLAFVAIPVLIVAAIWGAISSGFSPFD